MRDFPFAIVGFDLDGTLLDTHEDLGAAVNHALKRAGLPERPLGSMRALIGGGAKRMFQRALDEEGVALPDAEFKAHYLALLEYYEAHIAVHTRLFPGGAAMLDDLAARGVKIAVATNKFEALARKVIGELGLTERFYTIVGGDTFGPGKAKPAPDQLHALLERGGGGRAAYVGDTTFDIGAARAAGWPCVAVSFGFNDLPPHDLGADAVVDHFDALVPALATLAE